MGVTTQTGSRHTTVGVGEDLQSAYLSMLDAITSPETTYDIGFRIIYGFYRDYLEQREQRIAELMQKNTLFYPALHGNFENYISHMNQAAEIYRGLPEIYIV